MLNEVYLISSLPALSYGKTPPISLEEFRGMAKNELSSRSFKVLDQVSIRAVDSKVRKSKVKSVFNMQLALLEDISEIRKSRTENRKAIPGHLPGSLLEVNPLDREMQIMQWQWEKLDAIATGKSFTLAEVIVYKLKLQLLFRMNSFSIKRGEAVLDSVVNPDLKKED